MTSPLPKVTTTNICKCCQTENRIGELFCTFCANPLTIRHDCDCEPIDTKPSQLNQSDLLSDQHTPVE